jgi:hypothetical protein
LVISIIKKGSVKVPWTMFFNQGKLPHLQKNSKPYIKNKIILPKLHLKKELLQKQRYGYGSGIRCLFDPWMQEPEWVKNQEPDSGSGMNNPDHTYFRELKNNFLG